ncbi:hypothetical protein CQW23_28068 [Capsicum baccatum]|uniref:PHD-type domain-containing protein n=1 Tax=Capsicum baccatum TaxID=33114 RepID=A0A2G2VFG6_CAPBA|nr:hypothetical protein CQW23_28068 [Capsicum baccatum]
MGEAVRQSDQGKEMADLRITIKVDEPEPERVSNEPKPTPERLPGVDAYSDVAYLYTSFRWGYHESIVACDICDRWHHSRCSGIEDAEAVPPLFVCSHKGRLFHKLPYSQAEARRGCFARVRAKVKESLSVEASHQRETRASAEGCKARATL